MLVQNEVEEFCEDLDSWCNNVLKNKLEEYRDNSINITFEKEKNAQSEFCILVMTFNNSSYAKIFLELTYKESKLYLGYRYQQQNVFAKKHDLGVGNTVKDSDEALVYAKLYVKEFCSRIYTDGIPLNRVDLSGLFEGDSIF